ncbi:CLUMA_CG012669, isoform A [Clunio marinus]|uniref:CLUMA_CG012669, isoform A n=1 Tax=Clunio marinus TaxID=568069 RepID=A0A1J1IGD1_9DIPT|nr:CLUMA_CG012669, isoform A [Clunio marinus]
MDLRELNAGDLVWFESGLGYPVPGEIKEVHGAAQIVLVESKSENLVEGKILTFAQGEGSLKRRKDVGLEEIDDLTKIEDLHEASVIWNLRARYDASKFYTSIGSILVSINPYSMHPHLYGLEMAKKYEKAAPGQMPPHLFGVGQKVYSALENQRQNQVIIVTGESGSGKTEATKLIMQYLVANNAGSRINLNRVSEQILEASSLLESFGNAKSSRNDNSSRFGKYLEVYFKAGVIIGAKVNQYLLEKYRVVSQVNDERNFHIFYDMLGGLNENERKKYGLLEADKYFYLNQGASDCNPNRDWSSLQSAMHILDLTDNEREGINRILGSILHLGNVYFHRRQLRSSLEGVEIGSEGAECKWASHLLDISSEDLIRSLMIKITEARGELLYFPLTIDQALDARDAFAKLEQAEYQKERLEWTPLGWEDNLPVIHLLAKKPVGIFHLLDDESNFPRSTDKSFMEKCHYNHALNELYSRARIGAQEFGIKHYAGTVWYNVDGFLGKNRDVSIKNEVLELLESSSLPLLQDITKQLKTNQEGRNFSRNSTSRFVSIQPRKSTVAARFSDSLQHLMTSISKCNPTFVRCINPNYEKQPKKVDMSCLLNQVRYLGLLQTVNIRKQGYPVRLRFPHFVERYRHLLHHPVTKGMSYRDLSQFILDSLNNVEEKGYQLGATRVFLRESLHLILEQERNAQQQRAASTIQRNVRKMLLRQKTRRQHKSAIILQKVYRGYRERKRYQKIKKGITKAQALYRGRKDRRRYEKMKNELRHKREAEIAMKENQKQYSAHKLPQKESNDANNSIFQLDVPAELAFIYSKIENWNQVHNDKNLVKVVGTVPGPPIASDLPNDLEQFSFNKFSSVYCNGIHLHPRKDPITQPFLSRTASKDKDFNDSLSMFKLILRWTGDSSLDAVRAKVLADYIVNKGLMSRNLRDEILVQLCNQCYRAEEKQSTKIWQLISHCLSSFSPSAAFQKYLLKFIIDNAPQGQREILVKKILRNHSQAPRNFPPAYLEWRAAKEFDIALGLTLPDNTMQTVAIDSWTTCEEAGNLSLASFSGFQAQGWTVVLDDSEAVTETCGLDFILDLIGEMELCSSFPATRNYLLRLKKNSSNVMSQSNRKSYSNESEPLSSPKRPDIPPPLPPVKKNDEIRVEYVKSNALRPPQRKTSIDLLSRSSALNERYFDVDKSRSRSLDDLLNSDSERPSVIETPNIDQPLNTLGLSESRLNDRYLSSDRFVSLKQHQHQQQQPPIVSRQMKLSSMGRRITNSNSIRHDRSDLVRSSGMSDTSECASLASHVRRVRVPSQASDVDQFLDDLFSPVLDGNLDELSDARSLAASIRGNESENVFFEAPIMIDELNILQNPNSLSRIIKGGGDDPGTYQQQQVQRAFLESAMEQNIKIQQQLIAQNEALQTLLCQQKNEKAERTQNFNVKQINSITMRHDVEEGREGEEKNRKDVMEMNSKPPPPPPMPPPLNIESPFQRPFMDAYGRAKTVRIGKWRWPPPTDNGQVDGGEDYISFKLRQNQRKSTPQSQHFGENSNAMNDSREISAWEEFDIESMPSLKNVERSRDKFPSVSDLHNKSQNPNRVQKRSFDIGSERPSSNSVGKLKLSLEMRQRLEQVTAGHSVRSITSNKSELDKPSMKIDDARKAMLEQQLGGGGHNVRNQIQRMEIGKTSKPFMPLPSVPAPPPPIRPANSVPPPIMNHQNKEKKPSFLQRLDKDTLGVKENFYESWELAENEQIDFMYKRSRSHSREREHFSESVWDRTEVEGPPSTDEINKMKDKTRQNESSQMKREREHNLSYATKNNDKEKQSSANEKATFKNHMFSLKEHERKTSSLIQPVQKGKYEESENDANVTPLPAIPKPIHGIALAKPTACLTYNSQVSWKLKVKKEFFTPTENMGTPAVIDLLYAQIVADLMKPCLRINSQEKRDAKSLLSSYSINLDNNKTTQATAIAKRKLIEMARSWPLYFSRLFMVSASPQYPEVVILAVHQSGAYLVQRNDESLTVLKAIPFSDLLNVVTLPRPATLQLNLKNGTHYVLHTVKAASIQAFMQSFLHEFKITKSNYLTPTQTNKMATSSLMHIKKQESNEEIRPTNVTAMRKHSGNIIENIENINSSKMIMQKQSSTVPPQDSSICGDEELLALQQPASNNHSLLQFALQHFRNDMRDDTSQNRSEKEESSDNLYINMVKCQWQGTPLRQPLLKLPSELNSLALECFECVLRYCGDLPQDHDYTEVKCVYTVLMHCHKHLILRDEIYCQLMKQTTANQSACADSCQRAWRLLSILAAYFSCSEALKPYLIEHLTSIATDRRGTAAVCLANLRKTARCGGRKNVPSVEEVTAVSAGRSARRQIYRLPGGAERVVNTRCSTVVADVINELCCLLGIESEIEQQEFSLYCIVQGDAFTMPLSSDEYILDVTTELLKTNQPFYLIFCRSVWHFPLKRDPPPTPLYIEVLFNQVAPDYLEGLLLEIPSSGTPSLDYVRDIARIAATLHRAADLNHIPVMKEIKFLLPKPALGLREIKPAQWVNLVQAEFLQVVMLTPLQCKAQFLSILSTWPLFGSSFFAVKRVFGDDIGIFKEENGSMWRELIMALNNRGVLFLDSNTHETLHHWNFIEIISTRKIRSEDALFLDMKVGNLLQQSVIRVQTEQAHEISRIMRQYISMAQINRK